MHEQPQPLMGMEEYFDARSAEYADFHLARMDGGLEGKRQAVLALPNALHTLLDLGIGTGLELSFLWERFPAVAVTGIDISEKMLAKLRETYPNAPIKLHHMDYFSYAYPSHTYDAVLSVASLHHFSLEQKQVLYRKIYSTLQPSGVFVLCDCFAQTKEAEEACHQQFLDALSKQSTHPNLVHFDRPLYYENEQNALCEAGFDSVECVWQAGTTMILRAKKEKETIA